MVPVLSDKIQVVVPNVSAAKRLRTNPFLLKICCIPRAKTKVMAAGNPDGIAPIAIAVDVNKRSYKLYFSVNTPKTNIINKFKPTRDTINLKIFFISIDSGAVPTIDDSFF